MPSLLEDIIHQSPVVAVRWTGGSEWFADYVSANIARYGHTPDAVRGKTLFDLVYHKDVRRVRQELAQHLQDDDDEFVLEYRMPARDGPYLWVEHRLRVCREGEGACSLQGVILDITERKRSEDTIRHQAFHDTLTGLPNRVLFTDRLSRALSRARRYRAMLAVLFLDLDNFKVINDTLGHAAGDYLLRGVTDRLRLLLRDEDTIARFGGDEFIVLLPEVKCPDDVATVAEKINRALYPPFHYQEHDLCICASIGISLYPRDGRDAEALVQNADTALYHVKEQGKDGFRFYSPSMYQRTLEKMALESQLRVALQRGEFTVHYEPQVSLLDNQLLGTEARLCWQHPERGVMEAPQFMPLAEETGCSVHLTGWLLREACAQANAWYRSGYPCLQVSVNLGERLYRQEDLADMVQAALRDSGLAPQCLVLGVSEDVAMRDVAHSTAVMRRLQRLGVSLVLDHFGRGYSSLIYLKRFPICSLKIDRSIIRGMLNDESDEAIAMAVTTLAHRLQLTVTADGVETEDQQQLLCDLQCDRMQGPLFSKPLPPQSFEQLLRFLQL